MYHRVRSATRWTVAILLVLLTGCQQAVFEPVLKPDADFAVVYLYRPAATTPGLAKPKVLAYPEIWVDGKSVGTVGYDKYLGFRVTPGKHTLRVTGLTAGARNWDFRDIEQIFTAAAGEQLFRRLRVDYNTNESSLTYGMQYYYYLTPVSPEEAQYEIRHIAPQQ